MAMADSKTLEHIDQWVEDNWEDVVKDIEKLVTFPVKRTSIMPVKACPMAQAP